MKSSKFKYGLLSNVALVMVLVVVALVSFVPEKIVPIYGGESNSAIYHGNKANKNVSIMVNVYENSKIVEEMVDVFNQYDAQATFFIGGCWADDNAQTLIKIAQNNHEIGNHGYFHKDQKNLNYDSNYQEISLCGVVVEALCGIKPKLFAPPSGSYGDNTLASAFDLGYKVIMWSKDTIDWRDSDENKIFTRATSNLTNGDLILMHPKQHTLNVLPKILEYLSKEGYNMVSVSKNLE